MTRDGDLYHVLIVSNDEYNAIPEAAVWALAVVPGAGQTPLAIHLCSDDLLRGGSVSIPSLVQILDRATLKENLGYVAPGTMSAVEDALREFLDLS